jgi:hypothetical protein
MARFNVKVGRSSFGELPVELRVPREGKRRAQVGLITEPRNPRLFTGAGDLRLRRAVCG